jgi:hypothetical protein
MKTDDAAEKAKLAKPQAGERPRWEDEDAAS